MSKSCIGVLRSFNANRIWGVLLALTVLFLPVALRADTYQYTVTWNEVVNIMPTASFQFTEPALAAFNGTVPIGQVTTLSNPCSGSVSDANPAIYGNTAFSMTLDCLAPGWANLYLDSLSATTSTITAPGTYNFLTSSVKTSADYGHGRVPYYDFQQYGGSVVVTQIAGGVPEPTTLVMFGSGLLGLAGAIRRKLLG